jgi:hypothetical protein
LIGGRVVFRVYDENTAKTDELIGSIHFELKDIIPDVEGKTGRFNEKFDWKNIYGSPLDVRGKNTNMMNNNPELGSLWKGRILIQCKCEETEKPLLLVRNLEEKEIIESRQFLPNRTFSVCMFIAAAIGVPFDNENFFVTVRIGDQEWTSGDPPYKSAKYNRYNWRIPE